MEQSVDAVLRNIVDGLVRPERDYGVDATATAPRRGSKSSVPAL